MSGKGTVNMNHSLLSFGSRKTGDKLYELEIVEIMSYWTNFTTYKSIFGVELVMMS